MLEVQAQIVIAQACSAFPTTVPVIGNILPTTQKNYFFDIITDFRWI